MIELSRRRGRPVYLQIKEQLERRIASGTLEPGDALPSVRVLAARLSVNPNTVIRAYRELESQGLIETRQGEGSFVAAGARREAPAARLLAERAREFARSARELGFELDDVTRALERVWRKEEQEMTHNGSRLSFQEVSFGYGRKPVLEGFDLSLAAGEVTLLAGPNGSGKTTALWLAEGLLRPDSGHVRVLDADPFRQRRVLGRVGFLPEGAPLPPSWTVRQVLAFQRGTFPNWDEAESQRLAERFALEPGSCVKRLSRGERGKLALAAMLATRPDVLLLDEPALGLDVATRRLLASEILGQLADRGSTVLLASHQIAEAESAVDRFTLLGGGRIAADEPVSTLLERHRLLAWDAGRPEPPPELDVLPLPEQLGPRALARRWDEQAASEWLAAGGQAELADLETIYLSMTGEVEHA